MSAAAPSKRARVSPMKARILLLQKRNIPAPVYDDMKEIRMAVTEAMETVGEVISRTKGYDVGRATHAQDLLIQAYRVACDSIRQAHVLEIEGSDKVEGLYFTEGPDFDPIPVASAHASADTADSHSAAADDN